MQDARCDVAIYVKDRRIRISKIDRGEGYIRVALDDYDIIGCYVSPNIEYEDFKMYIDKVMGEVKKTGRETINGGISTHVQVKGDGVGIMKEATIL